MTIQDAVQYYKENIDRYWADENYKWIGAEHFQEKWNAETENFPAMLKESLALSFNLLSGAMYYPSRMIVELAEYDSEGVRNLFKDLFDETRSFVERYTSFRSGCETILNRYRDSAPEHSKAKNHYQDLRAICVYLSFRYPEKYYLYKSRMYTDFKKLIDYTENSSEVDPIGKNYDNFVRICQAVIEEVRKDPELLAMQKERVETTKGCVSDSELHLLAQTIIYVAPNMDDDKEYWPSKEEYDPQISTSKWIELLKDKELTSENNLRMLALMLDFGSPATCSQLADRYGLSANFFNKGSSAYAEQVAKKTGCPVPPERNNANARWWPILFVGRPAAKEEKGTYVWKMRDELKAALEQMDLPEIGEEMQMKVGKQIALNTILFGPPGTGKTYNTVLYAVAIVEDKSVDEIMEEAKRDYKGVKSRYDSYKDARLIAFTTFHQSYGYEEFIEGIRPVLDNSENDTAKDVSYQLRDGLFKEFCGRAICPVVKDQEKDLGLNRNPVVWKVSLEGSGDNVTRKECLENDHIRIGWDEYGPEINDKTVYTYGGEIILDAFINRMQIGDIVLSCYSKSEIDAIGVVTGDYEWGEEYSVYRRVRKVKWLVKNIRENILRINNGANLTLSSVYRLKISLSDVMDIVRKYSPEEAVEPAQNYVFIIDEINRGNISKIFGELITLIEPTKRLGMPEETKIILPCSGEQFGVPSNVYILGTMNTADRSIALMDTALRRRFEFREMMPDTKVLEGIQVSAEGETLDVAQMLQAINTRIEYLYDREHTIGHAFFTGLRDNPSIDLLADIFQNKVVPLLQEYFYEDYEKIQLVLGDNDKSSDDFKFVLDKKVNENVIFKKSPQLDLHEKTYEIQKKAFERIRSYIEITEAR